MDSDSRRLYSAGMKYDVLMDMDKFRDPRTQYPELNEMKSWREYEGEGFPKKLEGEKPTKYQVLRYIILIASHDSPVHSNIGMSYREKQITCLTLSGVRRKSDGSGWYRGDEYAEHVFKMDEKPLFLLLHDFLVYQNRPLFQYYMDLNHIYQNNSYRLKTAIEDAGDAKKELDAYRARNKILEEQEQILGKIAQVEQDLFGQHRDVITPDKLAWSIRDV